MTYFVIGDIHGCYYTMRQMIDNHWDIKSEKLILLGDLVFKGKHTFAVLEYIFNLQNEFKEQVIILKGNNDHIFENYFRNGISLIEKQKFENYNLEYTSILDWMQHWPHFYENGKVFFSHAGVSIDTKLPVQPNDLELIFNRKKLKNLQKTQFLGHIVVEKPLHDADSDAWYLDTGAGFGQSLTGIKVQENAAISKIINIPVNPKDICKN